MFKATNKKWGIIDSRLQNALLLTLLPENQSIVVSLESIATVLIIRDFLLTPDLPTGQAGSGLQTVLYLHQLHHLPHKIQHFGRGQFLLHFRKTLLS